MTSTAKTPESKELLSSTREVPCGKLQLSSKTLPCGGAEVVIDASGVPDKAGLALHWSVGTQDAPSDWTLAPEAARPPKSSVFSDGKACRSPFDADGTVKFKFSASDLGGPPPTENVADSESEDEDLTEAEEAAGESESANRATPLQQIMAILIRQVDGADDQWLHSTDGAGDLVAPLRSPPPPPPPGKGGLALARRAAADEGAGSMNLFRRFCLVNDALGEVTAMEGPDGIGVLLAWLRMSSNRILPWYEGHNYQGKDMAYLQKALACGMAVAAAQGGEKGHLARLALAVLPRGGGDGDAIRMGILNLMRENGIKEGHRPGIEDKFIAQWHQKLHSNTTRDDIAIGEAYLHFLRGSGDWGDFWWHLWEHNKLDKADLAAMKAGWRTSGITGPAQHLPQLIPAFEHLLWIIKITHSGADLDEATKMARGHIGDDVQWDVDDLLKNRDQWWVPGKIVNIRQRMESCWRNPESRDSRKTQSVLMLDIALESFFRTKLEGMDLRTMSRDDRAVVLELALDGGAIAVGSDELGGALALWKRLLHNAPHLERWSPEWALAADAALENIALAVSHVLDRVGHFVQTPATMIGKAVKADKSRTMNFGEEVVRGHALFPVSAILGSLHSEVRELAGLSKWQMISLGSSPVGQIVVRSLADMQGEEATAGGTAQIVLSKDLGGLEDVPPGVVAVLTSTPIDLLSHIAIRARNLGVMLASSTDEEQWAALVSKADSYVSLSVDSTSGAVVSSEATAAEAKLPTSKTDGKGESGAKVELVKPETLSEWAILPADYKPAVVGGKSMGLAKLSEQVSRLGSSASVPPSFALPFGSFEKAIKEDTDGATKVREAIADVTSVAGDAKAVRKALKKVRKAAMGVAKPKGLEEALAKLSKLSPSQSSQTEDVEDQWNAIKSVWASKWTERAYLSRRNVGIPDDSLYMGVLCMDLVAAEYAFVLHTADPLSGDSDTVLGEVVVGLGETLVGNSPGRAMSFSASKSDAGNFKVHSLPSKLHAHHAPDGGTMIARSDSNGEDLEGFAGAGLYDSVCAKPANIRPVCYADEKLTWDKEFRGKLISKLVGVAKAVEDVIGTAQDIEGCVVGEDVYLVQSRAQV